MASKFQYQFCVCEIWGGVLQGTLRHWSRLKSCVLEQRGSRRQIWGLAGWLQWACAYLKKKKKVALCCLCICEWDRKCVCRWVLYTSDTPELCVCACVRHSSKLLSASILPAPVFLLRNGEARLRRLQPPIQAHTAGLPCSTHGPALQYTPLNHALPCLMKCWWGIFKWHSRRNLIIIYSGNEINFLPGCTLTGVLIQGKGKRNHEANVGEGMS